MPQPRETLLGVPSCASFVDVVEQVAFHADDFDGLVLAEDVHHGDRVAHGLHIRGVQGRDLGHGVQDGVELRRVVVQIGSRDLDTGEPRKVRDILDLPTP